MSYLVGGEFSRHCEARVRGLSNVCERKEGRELFIILGHGSFGRDSNLRIAASFVLSPPS